MKKNVGDPKEKKNWTAGDLLLVHLDFDFSLLLQSRIAAAFVESDATEEQKEEATAKYLLIVPWPLNIA